MKSCHLIVCLALVPLVLAKLPPSIRTKLIYHQNYVLAETREERALIDHKYDDKFYLDFIFAKEYVSIDIYHNPRPIYSFVIETLDLEPGKRQNHSCLNESSASLRRLIFACKGIARVRELNEEEKKQMQTFIADESKKGFQVIFDNGYIVSKAAKAQRLAVDARALNSGQVTATMSSGFRMVQFSQFRDKSFAVEESDEKHDYTKSPVQGLETWPGLCEGKFTIRPITDEERVHEPVAFQ